MISKKVIELLVLTKLNIDI